MNSITLTFMKNGIKKRMEAGFPPLPESRDLQPEDLMKHIFNKSTYFVASIQILLSIVLLSSIMSCGEENIFSETEPNETMVAIDNQENDGTANKVPLRPNAAKIINVFPQDGSIIATDGFVRIDFDKVPSANYKYHFSRGENNPSHHPSAFRVLQTNSIKIELNNAFHEGELKLEFFWEGGNIELTYNVVIFDPIEVFSSVNDGATHFDLSRVNPISFSFNKKVTGTIKFQNEFGEKLGWTDGVLSNETSTFLTPSPQHNGKFDNGIYRLTGAVKDLLGEEVVINMKFSLIGKWKVRDINGLPIRIYLKRIAENQDKNVDILDIVNNEFVFYSDKRWNLKLQYTYVELNERGERILREQMRGIDHDSVYFSKSDRDNDWIEIPRVGYKIQIGLSERNELISKYRAKPEEEEEEEERNIGRVERRPLFVPPKPEPPVRIKALVMPSNLPKQGTLLWIPKND